MTLASHTCVCGQRVYDADRGHPERCRGPVLGERDTSLGPSGRKAATPPAIRKDAGSSRSPSIRLRQPTHEPWDWAVLMADQDADDRRGTGGHDYSGDDVGVPWERRH